VIACVIVENVLDGGNRWRASRTHCGQ